MAYIADVAPSTTIRSVWGNQIRDATVAAYSSTAERDLKTSVTPDGALCTVAATGLAYVKSSGAWRPLEPALLTGHLQTTYSNVPWAAGQYTLTGATCATPAGYRSARIDYRVWLAPIDGVTPVQVQLKLFTNNGGTQIQVASQDIAGHGSSVTISCHAALNIAGDVVLATITNTNVPTVALYADPQYHDLTVAAYPSALVAG